jgi:hypothetical protein
VVDEGFVLPLLTLDLKPDYFDVAAMPWVERELQEIGKIMAAVRLIAAVNLSGPRIAIN